MRALIVLVAFVAVGGCGDDGPPPGGDAAPADAGPDVAPDAGATTFFEDVAARAGITFSRRAVEDYQTVPDRIGGGVCVIDVDGTPPLDLFFPARRGQASALFVGRGVLDYADEADARGLLDVGDALGCLAYDFEGDGDADLVVTGLGTLAFFENDGGLFNRLSATLDPAIDPRDIYASAAAGDVDGDGDLDLLVAGYERYDPSTLPTDCGALPCTADILALPPISSRLLIRDAGTFSDRTRDLAPALLGAAPTFMVSIVDVDGDGLVELIEWNDLGDTHPNRPLSRDADGVFRDASATLGLDVTRRGTGGDTMGWSVGDIDGDGRFDHVTSDYHGAATAVFFCGDSGCFDDAPSARTTATSGSFRWGLSLFDVDLDGDLDLFESTGHLVTTEENAARGFEDPQQQPANLLRWSGDHFEAIRPGASDALAVPRIGRGLAVLDLDDDGRLDVVQSTAEGPAAVLRNVRTTRGHFLRVIVEGEGENRDAIGAVVRVIASTRTYLRQRVAGEGLLGNFDPRLHFGLPDAEPVDVEVTWPSGETTRAFDVAPDAELLVRR